MRITFFPDFKSRTRVPTGPGVTQIGEDSDSDDDGMKVVFTAKLDASDYDEFVRRGARLEVWTNAPTPHNGSKVGEWGTIQFVREDISGSRNSGSSDGGEKVKVERGLYLDGPTSNENSRIFESELGSTSPYIIFRAYAKIPRAPPKRFYGLTYRIIYPSGVFWLGSPATNAILEAVPDSSDDRMIFDEEGSWSMSSEKGIRVLSEQTEVGCDSDKVIGKLNMRDYSWKGWAILGTSAKTFVLSSHTEIPPSRLIFLIPEATSTTDTILVPDPIVLRTTSWHSPISISCQGSVIFHSCADGTVERHSHIPGSREYMTLLESDAVSSCPGPEIIALTEEALVLNPHNDSSVSAIVYILPLTRDVNREVKISSSSLPPLLRHSKSVLFNSDTRSSVFWDHSSESGGKDITISVGNSGGHVIISPVYDITSSDGKNAWELSLLGSPVFPELIVNESSNPLPTPPASPPLRLRQSVSFVLPEETNTEEGKAVIPSPRPWSEERRDSRSPSPTRMTPLTLGLGLISTLTHIRDVLLLRFHAFMMRGPIRSHIFAIFSVATWLLGAVVRKVFSYTLFVLPLRRTRRAITRRSTGSEKRSSKSGGAKEKGASTSQRDDSATSSTLQDDCSMVKRHSQVASEESDSILGSSTSTILASPTSTVGPDPLHQHQQTPLVTTYEGAKWRLTDTPELEQKYFLLIRSKSRQPLSDELLTELDGEPTTVSSIGVDSRLGEGEGVTLLQVERTGATAGARSLVVKVRI